MRALVTLTALAALAGCGGGGDTKGDTGIDSAAAYDAVVETTHGTFTIRLATEEAPKTTASFVRLARDGYFDGTVFHRIVPGFVIQGGDPTGTGTGGPDARVVEAPPPDLRYTKGVVAMAKRGDEPAGASGSQFFVVTGEDVRLPPEYALLGRVTGGLDVVERIGRLGDANERPTERVAIEHVEIREE